MIRIFKLVLLLVVSQVAFGQAPSNYTNINGRYRWIAGMFDSTFHIPKGTTNSLRVGGSTNAGALFYNTTDSTVYTYTGTQWIKLRGVIVDTTSLSNRINLKLNISDTAAMLAPYLRKVDTASLSNRINLKLNISDTATMLGNYLNNVGYGLIRSGQVVRADSATLATYFLRRKDSLTTTNPLGYVTRTILADTAAAIRSSATSGFVPYTGATQNVNLGQFGLSTKFVQFDTSSQAVTDRRLQWSNDDGTLQFGMTNGATITQRVGLEQFARVKNVQGTQINKGQVVYIYGASGDRASVKLADNRADSTSSRTLGVATEDIPINDVGLVGTFGVVSNLNLAAYAPGDVLYLDSIPGGLTKTKPQAPYHIVFIGVVERANAGNGQLFTNVQNGYELEELHNVRITSPVRNNALLVYDSTRSLWIDTTIAQAGLAVTQVNTNSGSGITGGPITTVGTIAADTLVLSTRAWRQKGIDSVQGNLTAGLALKLNISDTANMLNPYLRKVDTASLSNRINLKVNISDTASMLLPYLRKADTTAMLANYVNNVGYGLLKSGQVVRADSATLANYFLRRKDSLTSTNLLGYVTRKILADTAAAIRSADAGGTVTSVATNNGTGITGGTITTAGTLAIDTVVISTRAWRQKGVDSLQANINLKLNISDTASMLSPYLRKIDTASLSNRINIKLNISDTSSMLTNYLNNVGYGLLRTGQVARADSATLASYFLRRKDSLTSTNLLGYVTRTVLADSAAAIRAAAGGGSIGGSGTINRLAKFTASGTIGNSSIADSSSSVAMTISSGGNVTVSGAATINNTTSSTNALSINTLNTSTLGTALRLTNTGTLVNSNVEIMLSPASNAAGVRLRGEAPGAGNNDFSLYTTAGSTLNTSPAIFATGGTNNVAIATTTPGSKLQVNGNAAIGYSASTAAPTNGLAVSGNVGIGTSSPQRTLHINNPNTGSGADGSIKISNATIGSGTLDGADLTININGEFYITNRENAPTIFETNGTERMRITSGGDVGIGTSAPTSQANYRFLQVNGTANAVIETMVGGTRIGGFDSDASNLYVGTIGSFPLIFRTGVTERMRITSGGQVGIGTTTFNYNAAGRGQLALSGSTDAILEFQSGTTSRGYFFANAANFEMAAPDARFINFSTNGSERMRITSGGNVGIGTTNPETKVQIGTTSDAENTLTFKATATGTNKIFFSDGTGDALYAGFLEYQHTGNNLSFGTNSAERMRISGAGLVGIGINAPTSTLHTEGSIAAKYVSKTATYTLDATDYTVVFNVSSAVTANLPDATTCTGRIYVIKVNNTTNTSAVTIDPNGAQTIDGNATYAIQCQYGIMIQSDGANWRIIADFGAGLNCL